MKILNLGCGTRTSDSPDVVNIDWSIYLRLKRSRVMRVVMRRILHGVQLERFEGLPSNIMVHDLGKGIPFASETVDVVYHSHVLEHLDREVGERMLGEVRRVLKVGGIHRIVVPDLEKACRAYLEHVEACVRGEGEAGEHDGYIGEMIEQCVRREAFSTSRQGRWRRAFENRFLGDARKRGETHQWMYDRVNLRAKLLAAGYREVHEQKHDSSLVPGWREYGLDENSDGSPYKHGSLYMEAVK